MDKEYGYKIQIANIEASSQANKLNAAEEGKDKRNKDTKSMEATNAYKKENNAAPTNFNAPPPVV